MAERNLRDSRSIPFLTLLVNVAWLNILSFYSDKWHIDSGHSCNQWRCPVSTFEEHGWLYFYLTQTQWQFQAVLGLCRVNQETSRSLRSGILAIVLWMNMMSEKRAIVYVCGGGVWNWNLPLDMAFIVQLPCQAITNDGINTLQLNNVIYVSKMNANLLSTINLYDHGYEISMNPKKRVEMGRSLPMLWGKGSSSSWGSCLDLRLLL